MEAQRVMQARVDAASAGDARAEVVPLSRAAQAVNDTKLQISDAQRIASILSDAQTALELLDAKDDAGDADMLAEASSSLQQVEAALDAWELERLLDMPYASAGAVLTITAGAGGTDAQARLRLCGETVTPAHTAAHRRTGRRCCPVCTSGGPLRRALRARRVALLRAPSCAAL